MAIWRNLTKDEQNEIRSIWRDVSIPINEAVRLTGRSLAWLYKHLGPAGRPIMPPGKAESMQAKSVAARIGKRMPERQALTIWRDPNLTIGEAIKRMPGWSPRTAYLRLGKRGLPTGRRGN